MFGIAPTPFDLRLVALRIPVRVHPTFWILGILLAGPADTPPYVIFLWVMCTFVSILVHELGHALVAEGFRWTSEIVLYWGGGLTIWPHYVDRTPLREIAVSLAGPCAGFGLYGLTIGINHLLSHFGLWMHPTRFIIFAMLSYINLYWGLVNLLPVLPLDGGHVCQSLLELCRFRNSLHTTLQVSAAVAGTAAFVFFSRHERFAGMLFAVLCLQNLASLQDPRSR